MIVYCLIVNLLFFLLLCFIRSVILLMGGAFVVIALVAMSILRRSRREATDCVTANLVELYESNRAPGKPKLLRRSGIHSGTASRSLWGPLCHFREAGPIVDSRAIKVEGTMMLLGACRGSAESSMANWPATRPSSAV